jgi:hypothetical protein
VGTTKEKESSGSREREAQLGRKIGSLGTTVVGGRKICPGRTTKQSRIKHSRARRKIGPADKTKQTEIAQVRRKFDRRQLNPDLTSAKKIWTGGAKETKQNQGVKKNLTGGYDEERE